MTLGSPGFRGPRGCLYAVVYARNRASVAAFEQSGFVPQIVLPDADNRPDAGWEDVVVLMRSLHES